MSGKVVEIIIKEKEKQYLGQFIQHVSDADKAFMKSIALSRIANKELWDKIREIYPEVAEEDKARPNLEHPEDGQWKITYFAPDDWKDSSEVVKIDEDDTGP